jgi:sec-independent protein translocase protein TatA
MTLALIPGLGTVGPTELIIVLTIILLLFGAKRIPELAKGLGTGIREFRRGTSGEADKKEVHEKEEKEEALVGGAGEKDSARVKEEATREEHADEPAGERGGERVDQGAKRAEQNL